MHICKVHTLRKSQWRMAQGVDFVCRMGMLFPWPSGGSELVIGVEHLEELPWEVEYLLVLEEALQLYCGVLR